MNLNSKQDCKVALITGGARRIGASIVSMLHQNGYKVIIHCHHSMAEAEHLASQLNQKRQDSALVVMKNLTDPDMAEVLLQCILQWTNRLDVLVNNASVFSRTCQEFDPKVWQNLFDTNVKAPMLLSLALKPLLKQHQGCIINITDTHAENPIKDYSAYCQSKAALRLQTLSLALEFGPDIRVNAVAPGAIAWPEGANTLQEEVKQKIIQKTPLKRAGDVKNIAQAVYCLIENPFITGQELKIDGGRSIHV